MRKNTHRKIFPFIVIIKIFLVFFIVDIKILLAQSAQEWQQKYIEVKEQLNKKDQVIAELSRNSQTAKQAEIAFDLAVYRGTIVAYEMFLNAQFNQPILNQQAISKIYELTQKADIVEGYRHFLRNYPDAPEAKLASTRLYEIAHAIAEEENTIVGYYEFLSNFPAAPENLRTRTLEKLGELEEKELYQKYQQLRQAHGDEMYRQFVIEKIGRSLYEEAIKAKKLKDHALFIRKYNTILYSNLFNDSTVRFHLLRDQELISYLEEIKQEIHIMQNDQQTSQQILLERLSILQQSIENDSRKQSQYMENIALLIQEQGKRIENTKYPFSWDNNKTPWENYMYLGIDVLEFVIPAVEVLNKVLR